MPHNIKQNTGGSQVGAATLRADLEKSLIDAYNRREITGEDIANRLGVAKQTAYNMLRRAGAGPRKTRRKIHITFNKDREWLYNKIHVEGKTLKEIGAEIGMTGGGIRVQCVNLGVPVGRVRKARNIKYQQSTTCPTCAGKKHQSSERCQPCLFKEKGQKRAERLNILTSCNCGAKKSVTANQCAQCYRQSIRGPSNPRYHKDRTNINDYRADRTSIFYLEWQKAVYSRDEYRCDICGSGKKLNAHHLESFAKNKERRFDVTNGVTMCRLHHLHFHRWYGKNATEAMFLSYKESMELSKRVAA